MRLARQTSVGSLIPDSNTDVREPIRFIINRDLGEYHKMKNKDLKDASKFSTHGAELEVIIEPVELVETESRYFKNYSSTNGLTYLHKDLVLKNRKKILEIYQSGEEDAESVKKLSPAKQREWVNAWNKKNKAKIRQLRNEEDRLISQSKKYKPSEVELPLPVWRHWLLAGALPKCWYLVRFSDCNQTGKDTADK